MLTPRLRVQFIATRILVIATCIMSLCACGGNQETGIETRQTPASPPINTAIINPNRSIPGLRKNYLLSDTGSNYLVRALSDENDATMIPSASSVIYFDDMSVNLNMIEKSRLTSPESLANLVELYIAFFNRIPDADGLEYWTDQMQQGQSLATIAESFYSAGIQFSDLTGYTEKMSEDDFVRIIYKNVLGRTGATAPPQQDVDYWASQLRNHQLSHADLVRAMLTSAHTFINDPQYSWVAHLLDNKRQVGLFFAANQGLNFNSDEESIVQGMRIAAAVTPDSTTAALAQIGVSQSQLDIKQAPSNKALQAQAVINTHCVNCHGPRRDERVPPLYNHFLLNIYLDNIYDVAIVKHSMPKEGLISNEELAAIQAWYTEAKH